LRNLKRYYDIYFFPTPPIKLNLGLLSARVGGKVLIATHLDEQSNYLPNWKQKEQPINMIWLFWSETLPELPGGSCLDELWKLSILFQGQRGLPSCQSTGFDCCTSSKFSRAEWKRAFKVIIIPNTSPSPDSHRNGDRSQNLGETFELTQMDKRCST